jgi:hypothetical protein
MKAVADSNRLGFRSDTLNAEFDLIIHTGKTTDGNRRYCWRRRGADYERNFRGGSLRHNELLQRFC